MSFYRIYRPKVLDEIDNAVVRRTVEVLLTKPKNQLPHAYLLVGPKGTGKTTTARVLAKLFNCEHPAKSGAPCGTCPQCKAIAEGQHLDVMEIDAASNTGVDNIRDLRDRVALAPAQAAWKVFIIDEVHMLSTGAFNALLKTLEEPPAHAIFILATTEVPKIPATVVSRCQVISFSRALPLDITHALERIIARENMKIDADAIALVAEYADGSFRDAVKAIEQLSFQKGKITVETVRSTLSISATTVRDSFLSHMMHCDMNAALADIREAVNQGMDMKSFLTDCLRTLQRQLITRVMEKDTTTTDPLRNLIRCLTEGFAGLKTSPIAELPLELAVIEYCTSSPPSHPVQPMKQAVTVPITQQSGPTDETDSKSEALGLITLEKLDHHWKDVIDELKPYNHSVAGVMRSTRPKTVKDGIVTIEAFYPFHQEKLSEVKTREVIASVLKKLFGEKVKVEVVLGKK